MRPPACPMCGLVVPPTAGLVVERGQPVHIACHPGLADAAPAVARLLRERPGRGLCVACIAGTLGLTMGEAQTATGRLKPFRGFQTRYAKCGECGGRRQVVRTAQYVQERISDSTLRE